MNQCDSAGFEMTGTTAEGLAHFEIATHQLRCYISDPVASVDAALTSAPQMVMAHVLKAYLHLLGTEWSSPGFVDSSHATLRVRLALI